MLKCWSYRPEERPTFRYCLDTLQSLRNQCAEMQINIENTNRNLASSKCECSQFDFDLSQWAEILEISKKRPEPSPFNVWNLCRYFCPLGCKPLHVACHKTFTFCTFVTKLPFAFLTIKKLPFACYLTVIFVLFCFTLNFNLVSCLFVLSGGVFNRLYLLADENHNHQEGNHLCASVTFIFHIFIFTPIQFNAICFSYAFLSLSPSMNLIFIRIFSSFFLQSFYRYNQVCQHRCQWPILIGTI